MSRTVRLAVVKELKTCIHQTGEDCEFDQFRSKKKSGLVALSMSKVLHLTVHPCNPGLLNCMSWDGKTRFLVRRSGDPPHYKMGIPVQLLCQQKRDGHLEL